MLIEGLEKHCNYKSVLIAIGLILNDYKFVFSLKKRLNPKLVISNSCLILRTSYGITTINHFEHMEARNIKILIYSRRCLLFVNSENNIPISLTFFLTTLSVAIVI